MEMDGRPDGQRPDGFPALLDSYEAKARDALAIGRTLLVDAPTIAALLMREGLQYYHRYLSAFHLERYDLVERDTERNLRLFSLSWHAMPHGNATSSSSSNTAPTSR